jgi:hypothetical protein
VAILRGCNVYKQQPGAMGAIMRRCNVYKQQPGAMGKGV